MHNAIGQGSPLHHGFITVTDMRFFLFFLLSCAMHGVWAAELKIATLHPLLSEMAAALGGDAVEVVELFPANMELHEFAPGTREVAKAGGCRLLLACGKGTEPYLSDLKESLPQDVSVVELGSEVPDATVPGTTHKDPHWWNSPNNMKRASHTLARALAAADPAHAAQYRAGQRRYARRMDALMQEAGLALVRIPQENRCLVTAHTAMTHFCQAFGFEQIALHGVAKESEGDVATLAALLQELRTKRVRCVFSEVNESPRILETIAKELPADVLPLIPDGIHPDRGDYAAIFRHNVRTIVRGLSGN